MLDFHVNCLVVLECRRKKVWPCLECWLEQSVNRANVCTLVFSVALNPVIEVVQEVYIVSNLLT